MLAASGKKYNFRMQETDSAHQTLTVGMPDSGHDLDLLLKQLCTEQMWSVCECRACCIAASGDNKMFWFQGVHTRDKAKRKETQEVEHARGVQRIRQHAPGCLSQTALAAKRIHTLATTGIVS